MKHKKTKNAPVLVTVKELKTWLDGYCSAHGAGWSPTPEQWDMIKNKIFSLEDNGQPNYAAPVAASPPVYTGVRGPAPIQRNGMVLVPETDYQAGLDNAGSYGAAGAHAIIGATERPPFVQGQGGATKTPDNMSDVTLPSSFA